MRFKPVLVAFLAVGACAGCFAQPAAAASRTAAVVSEEYARLVEIDVFCDDGTGQMGSGVRVGGSTVITANHVVICQGADVLLIGVVTHDAAGKKSRYLASLSGASAADIARLDVFGLPEMSPVIISDIAVGERGCAVFALPEEGRRCGEVWPTNPSGKDKSDGWSDLHLDFVAEHGNSGGGVYDESGHLIGLVDTLRPCQGTIAGSDQVCLAGVTSLAHRRWIAAPSK